jgi:hypothetical protein
MSVYRNVLRDVGSAASLNYASSLPPQTRRMALYYTLVKRALEGHQLQVTPTMPEVTDDYGSLKALYEQASALGQEDDSDSTIKEAELARYNTEALADITYPDNTRPQDLRELITLIRSLNDSDREKRLLEALIERFTDKPTSEAED